MRVSWLWHPAGRLGARVADGPRRGRAGHGPTGAAAAQRPARGRRVLDRRADARGHPLPRAARSGRLEGRLALAAVVRGCRHPRSDAPRQGARGNRQGHVRVPRQRGCSNQRGRQPERAHQQRGDGPGRHHGVDPDRRRRGTPAARSRARRGSGHGVGSVRHDDRRQPHDQLHGPCHPRRSRRRAEADPGPRRGTARNQSRRPGPDRRRGGDAATEHSAGPSRRCSVAARTWDIYGRGRLRLADQPRPRDGPGNSVHRNGIPPPAGARSRSTPRPARSGCSGCTWRCTWAG